MAHFAKLDNQSIVEQVVVVNNNELMIDDVESEEKGIQFCQSLFGGSWIQTSYNGNFRKNYACVGFMYDPIRDAFIPPKPFNSWVLNEDTCQWESPIPYPNNGKTYFWNEDNLSWDEVVTE